MADDKDHLGLLLACFKQIFPNTPPNFYSYDHRLAIQKIAYFMKAGGLAFAEQPFGWYLRGPYSGKTASLAFEYMENPDTTPASLSTEQSRRLDILKELVSEKGAPSVDLIEVYGSLEFMITEEKIDRSRLVDIFLGRKPRFERSRVEKAVADLLALREST